VKSQLLQCAVLASRLQRLVTVLRHKLITLADKLSDDDDEP